MFARVEFPNYLFATEFFANEQIPSVKLRVYVFTKRQELFTCTDSNLTVMIDIEGPQKKT